MAAGARNPCWISSSILSSKPSSSSMAVFAAWNLASAARSRRRHRIVAQNNNSIASSSSSSSSPSGFRINGGAESENALSSWWQEAFARIDSSGGGGGASLLQLLHEGARAFQVASERNESMIKGSWIVKTWTGFGFDTKAWMKLLSYQVSVYSLLQAAMEIAMRGEGRDRDVHVFVQRSLSHQCAPLEDSIKKVLSSRDPSAASDWLWQQQLPFLVASYVNILEKDPEFSAVTSTTACPSEASDVALLRLTITACGAAMKLGPATLSCPAFTVTLTEEIGRLMNMQTEFVPITEVYNFSVNLGLRREFLSYFGSRAASSSRYNAAEERLFWVDLSESFLRNALTREGVLTKLRPYDTVEALERDLAAFGFFAALGRRARSLLCRKEDSHLDESIASLLRYLEGVCVLFYPQLSTLTYYQLFIEVVSEEMDWLPLFPEASLLGSSRESDTLAIYTVLNVCSRWVSDFLKYSSWVQDPAGSRVVDFLMKCESRLIECREKYNVSVKSRECVAEEEGLLSPSGVTTAQKQLQLFDEDLKNMEEAINKLEILLESSQSGTRTDKLEALRKDLERLRRLKKEAEALEASFKERADVGCLLDGGNGIDPDLSSDNKSYNDVFNESIGKLREASSDLWRGTQLLSTDVASATVLLKNGAFGQQLTEREKKMLRRTFTDLASVIPIGLLMLLPVTAVGHAAMLAAIQKYVPALIPSAYGAERLDLLRQLERVKQMEANQSSQHQQLDKKRDNNDD